MILVATPAGAYEVTAVQDGGTITGTVKFVGTLPKLAPIPVSKNRDVCGDRKASEALVLSAEKGVRGGVVLIEGVARGKRGGGDVVLDNNQCVFVSHVTAVGLKDRVAIRNSDAILHNTHGFRGAPTVFNVNNNSQSVAIPLGMPTEVEPNDQRVVSAITRELHTE